MFKYILLERCVMVNDFLYYNYTPERRGLIIDSIDTLADFNIADIPNDIENMLTADDLDIPSQIMSINSIIVGGMIEALNYHKIMVMDNTVNIRLLNDMVRSLKMVAEDYDPAYIFANIDFEITETNEPLDVYSSIVTLLTDSNDYDVESNVFSIGPEVIDGIHNLLKAKTIVLPPDDDDAYITRYRKFLNGRRTGLTYALVLGGVHLGELDFNNLFLLLEKQLYELNKDDLIFEIISLILISDAEQTEFLTIAERASRLFTETAGEALLLRANISDEYLKQTGTKL